MSVASGWWNWSKGSSADSAGQEKSEQKVRAAGTR